MSSFLFQNLVSFRPPRLLNNSLGWHIEYYILDPVSGKLLRKRFRLNDLKKQCASAAEFKQKANQVLQELTNKLVSGWSPQGEIQSSRYYSSLFEALEKFKEVKTRELRPDSMRTYKGIIKLFKEWLKMDCVCIDFGRAQALSFMDYCDTDRRVSATTWNNYLKVCRVIWGWLLDNLYIKDNPFRYIKKKRTDEKFRVVIPQAVRKRIADYFEQKNPGYLLVCSLVFYSLIRPTEITRLRVRDIDKENGHIFLPDTATKCHKSRFTPVDPALLSRLSAFVEGYNADDFIFARGFKPGANGIKKKQYLVVWERMRKDLNLPDEYQLYSLRDSGIRAKLEAGMDPTIVMHAAGHHNLAETTKYAIKANKDELASIVAYSPSFV
jgi:integrase